MRPTQLPIQWLSVVFSLGIRRPGRDPDVLLPSNAEFKNLWSYTSTTAHLMTCTETDSPVSFDIPFLFILVVVKGAYCSIKKIQGTDRVLEKVMVV